MVSTPIGNYGGISLRVLKVLLEADLIGLPVQVIVGDKKLKDGNVEVKLRRSGERFDIDLNSLTSKIKELIKES